MTQPYVPEGYSQIDGSYWQQSNCVPSVVVDLIDRATIGRLRLTPAKIRTAAGDYSGGMAYIETANAVEKATAGNVLLGVRFGLDRNQVRDIVASGCAIGISIDTAVTRYTDYRTNYFVGGHTVYVNTYRVNSKGRAEYLVEDPGTSGAGYMWWPADLLYRAAERRGGGRMNVLVGRDTEGTARKVRAGSGGAALRSATSTTSSIVGHLPPAGTLVMVLNTTNGGGIGWHRVQIGKGSGYAEGMRLQ